MHDIVWNFESSEGQEYQTSSDVEDNVIDWIVSMFLEPEKPLTQVIWENCSENHCY